MASPEPPQGREGKPPMTAPSGGGPWGPVPLLLVLGALLGLAVAPEYPGFWVIPLAAALAVRLASGPRALLGDLASLAGHRKKAVPRLALFLALALLAGSLRTLPVLPLGAPPEATLPPETLALLGRLRVPVALEARLGRRTARGPAGHLMDLYARASGLVTATVSLAEGQADDMEGGLRVARPDTLSIRAEGFSETVSPISREAIDASLRRMLAPNRLVYNLMGDGEKSVLDESFQGLSLWAGALEEARIFVQDLAWPGPGLPPVAQAADALVLAGPRMPLGRERETALVDFVAAGGRLLVLQDPLVSGLDPGALASFGLDMPRGLVVDPEAAWAGTDDRFIVCRDFPAHPITLGLEQPVVWPLAGSLALSGQEGQEGGAQEDIPVLRLSGDTAAQAGPETPEPARLGPEILFHTWAVALSSQASWLETDTASIARGGHRFQSGQDQAGPLVLATATTVAGGGRLALLADADLAANGFIAHGGNLAFLNNALHWLLGAEDDLGPAARGGMALDIDGRRARLLFWLPTVFWPLLALTAWYALHRRRQRATSL